MERNITLDYFKIFLCTLVIIIHLPYIFVEGSIWNNIIKDGIARIAVPCFFIINGYYLHSKLNQAKVVYKYVKKITVIYVVWMLVYSFLLIPYPLDYQFYFWLTGYYHLWYLPALIGGTIVLFFLKKSVKNNYALLAIAVILFYIGFYIQYFCHWDIHGDLRRMFYRNFLFMGFPFIFLGYFIKEKEKIIHRIPSFILIVITLLYLLFLIYEAYTYSPSRSLDFLTVLIFFCPALFLLILKYSKYKTDDGYIGTLTSGVYYVHLFAAILIIQLLNRNDMYVYALPVILFLSFLMSAIVIELNKRIKIFL